MTGEAQCIEQNNDLESGGRRGLWRDHDQPYGLYESEKGKANSFRFRHNGLKIRTETGVSMLPGWIVGRDALRAGEDHVVVHLLAPRFVLHWNSTPFPDQNMSKHDALSINVSLPIPLDEISEEILSELDARNRWVEEATAAVAVSRGDILQFLPDDVPDYESDDLDENIERVLPYD
jgi:hypothetical protein